MIKKTLTLIGLGLLLSVSHSMGEENKPDFSALFAYQGPFADTNINHNSPGDVQSSKRLDFDRESYAPARELTDKLSNKPSTFRAGTMEVVNAVTRGGQMTVIPIVAEQMSRPIMTSEASVSVHEPQPALNHETVSILELPPADPE